MERDFENNICLIGKNIDSIKVKLDLNKDNNENRIQNLWNIILFEKGNEENMDNVFKKVIDSLKEKNKKYSNKIYSYTIIYSLEEFNENQRKPSKNFIN